MQNAHFTRQVEIADRGAGPLPVRAVLDAERNNLLDLRQEKPLFEFVLKNEKVTALDPVWRYVERRFDGAAGAPTAALWDAWRVPR